jgi:hypothetical protein
MSIQFAGSKSGDDRRRRRLVVHSDETISTGAAIEDGAPGGGVASELVASEAAGPWVPVYEWRIWTYGAMIGLALLGSAFALARPIAFRPELAPLTGHLLQSPRPVLGVLIQTLFLFLSAQLAILIGWYRSQCKLDFRGRYRIWPWAAAGFALAAASSATNAHHLFGLVVARGQLLSWRADVVAWLLPASVLSLPLVLLLDRDVRRSRSSLFTLRAAWVLGLCSACLELCSVDLNGYAWFEPTRTIVPMFGVAVLFLGLWLHARIVAYVCPDPPDAEDVTARAQLVTGWKWIVGWLSRWIPKRSSQDDVEEEPAKSKRGRKKTSEDEDEAVAPKRKRKTPAKRTTRSRTRPKVVEEEADDEPGEEPFDESADNSDTDDSYDSSSRYAESDEESGSNDNRLEEDEEEIEAPPPVKRSNPQPPAASSTRKPLPEPPSSDDDSSESADDDEDGDDAVFRRDSGMTAEQMKGLSKRQKRDLRRQLREQQRNQRR